ncbi:uncharacterized protein LOC111699350 [Eurytemora carolleeae]|uniref:uncharacterized protein LOC111699350 n=1 Tax=Eurytemora carolleeae TaxID=1294199 RepID=UPI000C78451D|nr:uncharacterized protein LOC111699350 [Eurytemora carolleeae]|eukprot:XP_023325809.1 uncharacterized protein LOC111699350 [Eurytemora affinis]
MVLITLHWKMISLTPETIESQTKYKQFKEMLFSVHPRNLQVVQVKSRFPELKGRRRIDKILTLEELVQELEKQLSIFPERGILHPLRIILEFLTPFSAALLDELNKLEKQLKSTFLQTQLQYSQDVPVHVVEVLAREFDRVPGRDWERFAEGLGHDFPNRDEVCIRAGEIDTIERTFPETSKRLAAVFKMFSERCLQYSVDMNIIDVIVSTLQDENVFGTPYNKLARRVREEMRR